MSNRYKFLPILPEILLDTNSNNAVKLSHKIVKHIFIPISTFMWRIKRANIGLALRLSFLLFLFWICTATVLAVSPPTPSKMYSLAFFAPRGEGDPFWGLFIGFMQKAVDDFGVELRVHYADGNRERMSQQIAREATSKNRADVLVFPNFKKVKKINVFNLLTQVLCRKLGVSCVACMMRLPKIVERVQY